MNTRSRQARRADEIDEDVRTENVPLQSPSKVLEHGLADVTHDRKSVQSIRRNQAVDSTLLPVSSASQTSRNTRRSKASRVKQAEYEAQERLVTLEKEYLRKKFELKKQEMEQEMELEMKLLHKRIAVDLSRADEESIVECLPEQRNGNNSAAMVDRWLRSHSEVNNLSQGDREDDTALPERVEPFKHNVCREIERPISPIEEASVPIIRSGDQAIERLIGAFEKIATDRPPVRHAQDLTQFNGNVCDWLYFKVAYEDSTKLYKYSKAENMARLRTCLTGAAKETVAVLLSTACDPELIMKALDQCYGRPEIIIDKALEEIKKLPKPGYTAVEFNQFAIKVQNIAWLLKSVNDRSYTSNGALVREIVSKLNLHYQARWTDYGKANSNEKEPILITLSKYLLEEASLQLTFNYSRKIETATSLGTSKPRLKTNERVYSTQKKLRCLCCNGNHNASQCEEFLKMNLNQRWDKLRGAKACFLCLGEYHRRSECRKKRCGIDGCEKAHHRLLHWVVHKPQQQPLLAQPSTEAEVVMSTSMTARDKCQAVLLKVCPVTVSGRNGKVVKTHALLDEGSTITIIEEKLALELGVSGPSKPLKIQGVSSETKDFESQHVKIDVGHYDGGASYTLKARTIRDFDIGSQRYSADNLRYKHLVKLPLQQMIGEAKPQLLIRADNWHLIVSRKVYCGKKNEPAASLTRLGWILHGTAPKRSLMEDNERILHCIKKAAESDVYKETIDKRLEAILKQSFAIDALGITNKKRLTSADACAVQLFNRTIQKRERRYYLGLPWKTDNTKFPESYNMAFKRLKSIEQKMDQSHEFKQSYTRQINNLLEKNYARPIKRPEIPTSKDWYLPHFAVTNPNKPGKVRLVFDAAARSNEVCLNDELLDGPDLLQSLPGILFMFRERKYATTKYADIREMFLQIKVNEDDQVAQKFLWRGDNRDKPPKEYVMTSLIFGAKSSPFLAHSVRDYNASCYRTTHPNAYNAITRNHYMDDFVDSFDTEDEAIKTMQEVIEVHSYAGFILAGWNSNSQRIVEATPPELRTTSPKELGTTPLYYEKTGIIWEATEDVLPFNTSLHRVSQEVKQGIRQPTKRQALGAVMSIFDPLGLISYYTVTAKIILQQLCRLKTGWDEEIPTDQATEFKQWLSQLEHLKILKMPRWYNYTRGAELQLHVFYDASEQAKARVAYWRIGTGVIDVRITAKARVAPIKPQSIPRLKQAALIGARLAVAITEGHRIITKTHKGPDGETRSVEVETKLHKLRRPVTRIVVLPTESFTSWEGFAEGRMLRTTMQLRKLINEAASQMLFYEAVGGYAGIKRDDRPLLSACSFKA